MTRKNAADATDDENLVPGTFADPNQQAAQMMRALIKTAEEIWPGLAVMVCLMDRETERFNYASNVHRADMLAMLKAMLKRLSIEGRQ